VVADSGRSISKEDLLAVLRDELFLDTAGIESETPLFSSGLIDSFSLATLILAIEEKARVKLDPLDITLDNLDSIERILRFVATKDRSAL
jgi:acyl carrier protein